LFAKHAAERALFAAVCCQPIGAAMVTGKANASFCVRLDLIIGQGRVKTQERYYVHAQRVAFVSASREILRHEGCEFSCRREKEYPSRLLLARALVKRQRKNDVVKKV
jgi:hypothetical protein